LIESKVRFLFEIGPGVVRQLSVAGMSVSELDALFVSHCHGDHTAGFPYLMFRNFQERAMGKEGPSPVKVFCLSEVKQGLQNMLHFCYPPGCFPNFEINWVVPEPFKAINFGDLLLTFAPANHKVPVLAVRIDTPSGSVTYSADTVKCDTVIRLAQNCDILIHEAAVTMKMAGLAKNTKHSLAKEAGLVAGMASAKCLMLVHMFDTYVDEPESLIEEAKEHYSGNIIIPKQLRRYQVGPEGS